jgi:hypothetical protein
LSDRYAAPGGGGAGGCGGGGFGFDGSAVIMLVNIRLHASVVASLDVETDDAQQTWPLQCSFASARAAVACI